MPKFICNCGYCMNLSQAWGPHEFALIPAQVIEDIGDLFDGGGSNLTDIQFYKLIDDVMNTVYRCPECKRMHVEKRDQKNHFDTYSFDVTSTADRPVHDT